MVHFSAQIFLASYAANAVCDELCKISAWLSWSEHYASERIHWTQLQMTEAACAQVEALGAIATVNKFSLEFVHHFNKIPSNLAFPWEYFVKVECKGYNMEFVASSQNSKILFDALWNLSWLRRIGFFQKLIYFKYFQWNQKKLFETLSIRFLELLIIRNKEDEKTNLWIISHCAQSMTIFLYTDLC